MNIRVFVFIILLGLAALISYALPKPKYEGTDVLKTVYFPVDFGQWQGGDISREVAEKSKDQLFISDIRVRKYKHSSGAELMLFLLDAGNFHNPKVCFNSAGFSPKDLGTITIDTQNRTIDATSLLMEHPQTSFVITYWMCINGRRVDWFQQKAEQFISTIFNKKKAGIMIRIDVPADPRDVAPAIKITEQFIKDLSEQLNEKEQLLIFGQ